MFMPYVIEKTGRSQKPMDLPSRLLQDRIVHISGPITPELADIVKMQLVWLTTMTHHHEYSYGLTAQVVVFIQDEVSKMLLTILMQK